MRWIIVLTAVQLLAAQIKPVVSQRSPTGQVQVVRVAPRFATAIRIPETVSSVVVGDPERFLVEHSEKEPTLVLVKPVSQESAESNLLVLTTSGRQLSFLLRTAAAAPKDVDFVLVFKPTGSFLVGESPLASAEIANTAEVRTVTALAPKVPSGSPASSATHSVDADKRTDPMQELLDRQRSAALPELYGGRPPSISGEGDRVQAGVSEVIDRGRTVIVLFSALNPQQNAIEIMPPQVQLAGMTKKGALIRKDRWTTSEQLPVQDFRLSRRRLGPGERADGVMVFERPSFKQSHESLFLQVAESGAVDRPALAPIGFGVSATREENSNGR